MHVTRRFQQSAFSVYGALFALSLILINPWGTDRGYTWTFPKMMVVLVITLFHVGYLLMSALEERSSRSHTAEKPSTDPPDERWWFAAGLWALFLTVGLAACYFSPVAFAGAMRANFEMGDGWRYFALLAVFTLSNALVLKLKPELFRAQLYGILGGGLILALAVLPQVFDWTIDYTETSGQTTSEGRLASDMYKVQMPTGFHTSRGHAGFVTSAVALLSLVSLARSWLKPRYAWPLFFVISMAMWASDTRGVYLAYLAGLVYVGLRFSGRTLSWQRSGIALALVVASFLTLGGARTLFDAGPFRSFPNLATVLTRASSEEGSTVVNTAAQLSSGRLEKFEVAVKAIRERPLLGWGFNGFGVSWYYFADWSLPAYRAKLATVDGERKNVQRVLNTSRGGFTYIGTDGNEYRGRGYVNKAHNIFLDTAVSVGLLGLLIYMVLACFVIWVGARGLGRGLEVVAVVYIVYGLTWFESAQYSHLTWWALSAGFGLALGQVATDKADDRVRTASPEPA